MFNFIEAQTITDGFQIKLNFGLNEIYLKIIFTHYCRSAIAAGNFPSGKRNPFMLSDIKLKTIQGENLYFFAIFEKKYDRSLKT